MTGVDKKIQDVIWKPGGVGDKAASKVGLGSGGGGGGSQTFVPTYSGRRWDGYDWSCPDGAVETGATEDAKACITSQWHNPVWKAGPGGKWDWHCPNGTVPTDESQWEKKCVVGWTMRQQDNGAWKCPSGTTDSGNDWNNSSWTEAQKQCRRWGPYTVRILKNRKWVCPDGTKDTGKSWGAGKGLEWKQCKWTGP